MLSFNNIITSRVEDDHFRLKRALETSIENLKQMINVVDLMLKNQRSNYIITHEEFKTRLSRKIAIEIFQHLQIFVSSYTLKLVRQQLNKYQRARSYSDQHSLSSYIETLKTFMKLSCAHVIRQRDIDNQQLTLDDVYLY
jgi:hypothetical protein